jgi:AraC-like DNA-binding protein
MPVLPVPMVIALVLAAFLAQRWARGETHGTLLALIGICSAQAALIALVQHYGVAALRPVQPLMATVIPPVAWFAFQRAAGGAPQLRANAPHLAGPLAALACLAVQPALLDVLIPPSFTAYGAAMLIRLANGEESLPHSRLDAGSGSVMAWRVVALALIGSALSDVLIAWGLAQGPDAPAARFVVWVPSLVSSLSLLALGSLSLTAAIESRHEPAIIEALPSPDEMERDAALLARLDTHLAIRKPHLDPDLTLARLARQLGVPAKQLSAAINRGRRENVSRVINRLRIEEACGLLKAGASVTEAMLASGFNTKSNFNREFTRVTGKSPSAWLAAERGK